MYSADDESVASDTEVQLSAPEDGEESPGEEDPCDDGRSPTTQSLSIGAVGVAGLPLRTGHVRSHRNPYCVVELRTRSVSDDPALRGRNLKSTSIKTPKVKNRFSAQWDNIGTLVCKWDLHPKDMIVVRVYDEHVLANIELITMAEFPLFLFITDDHTQPKTVTLPLHISPSLDSSITVQATLPHPYPPKFSLLLRQRQVFAFTCALHARVGAASVARILPSQIVSYICTLIRGESPHTLQGVLSRTLDYLSIVHHYSPPQWIESSYMRLFKYLKESSGNMCTSQEGQATVSANVVIETNAFSVRLEVPCTPTVVHHTQLKKLVETAKNTVMEPHCFETLSFGGTSYPTHLCTQPSISYTISTLHPSMMLSFGAFSHVIASLKAVLPLTDGMSGVGIHAVHGTKVFAACFKVGTENLNELLHILHRGPAVPDRKEKSPPFFPSSISKQHRVVSVSAFSGKHTFEFFIVSFPLRDSDWSPPFPQRTAPAPESILKILSNVVEGGQFLTLSHLHTSEAGLVMNGRLPSAVEVEINNTYGSACFTPRWVWQFPNLCG
ncbi:hypothetical protein Pelo_11761 [Pelomyxa schiedti]|nr:hypothetical protein Pelo_11761 [Pelomyxa schiedti]